jgi:Clip-domain serine protease homolog masquerade
VTQRPRPATRRPPPPPTTQSPVTSPPDPREECPGSCIVSLLSFTCFRNAEMTEMFKCKKSGTQCCAPKTKIQEQFDKNNRNNTYAYNPNLGPINPNYNPQQQYYNTYPPPPANNNYPPVPPPNYPPPPANAYPAPPAGAYPPQPSNYPPPPNIYEPTNAPQQSSIPYEVPEATTSPRPPPYSKYVCGVKGNVRTAKEYLVLDGNSTSRSKRSQEFEREVAKVYKNKNTERLVLGTSLVPIPILYEDNSTFSVQHQETQSLNVSHRQARVVGGEDGDNGEWCWQVALINAQNQYLCGGALIGKFNDLITFEWFIILYSSRNTMGVDSSTLCHEHCSCW